jgi:integrase
MGGRIRLVGGKDVQDSNRDKTGLEPGLVPPEGHLPPPKAKVERQRRGKNLLTDRAIAAWIRGGMKKPLRDGQSLYLSGGARGPVGKIDYRHGGKENTYTIGPYGTGKDEFSLADMRKERDTVRVWLKAGLDPNIEKRAEKARNVARQGQTFELLGREFLETKSAEWSHDHAEARRRLFENDLLPALGVLPVTDLESSPATALAALKRIEQRGAHEVASKARVLGSMICRHGIITGRMSGDPFQHLGAALKRVPVVNRPTVPEAEMPALFAALDKINAENSTRLAFYFMIAEVARSAEARLAPWSEIDGELWRIGKERMKQRKDFVQPISPLGLRILERARELRQSDKADAFVFPGYTRGGHLSENAFTALLARAGFLGSRQVPHGFRSAFSSYMYERADKKGFDPIAIELCMSHRPGGISGIYNRSEYLEQRLKILTAWSTQLEAWGLKLP